MPRPPSKHPTELELEILKILWREGAASVRQVRDALVPFKNLAYTSVMTIMNIMTRKKYLKRMPGDGRFVYAPIQREKAVSGRMLSDLVNRVFDGSAAALMSNLLESRDLDAGELEQLRDLIRQKAREEKR